MGTGSKEEGRSSKACTDRWVKRVADGRKAGNGEGACHVAKGRKEGVARSAKGSIVRGAEHYRSTHNQSEEDREGAPKKGLRKRGHDVRGGVGLGEHARHEAVGAVPRQVTDDGYVCEEVDDEDYSACEDA